VLKAAGFRDEWSNVERYEDTRKSRVGPTYADRSRYDRMTMATTAMMTPKAPVRIAAESTRRDEIPSTPALRSTDETKIVTISARA